MPKAEHSVKLERFLTPFLRMVTDDKATVVFKCGDEELKLLKVTYAPSNNEWIIEFEEPYQWE